MLSRKENTIGALPVGLSDCGSGIFITRVIPNKKSL